MTSALTGNRIVPTTGNGLHWSYLAVFRYSSRSSDDTSRALTLVCVTPLGWLSNVINVHFIRSITDYCPTYVRRPM